jgi:nucleotide-binding universal stress UspA family protein
MIAIKKILVPTDLSNMSLSAIVYAILLAKKHTAEVTVLHVLPSKAVKEPLASGYVTDALIVPAAAPAGTGRQSTQDTIVERNQRLVHDFLDQKIGHEILKSVKINALVRFGKATKEIVAAAKEERSDQIVMTSHRSGFTRLLRGTSPSGSFDDLRAQSCPFNPRLRSGQNKISECLYSLWTSGRPT